MPTPTTPISNVVALPVLAETWPRLLQLAWRPLQEALAQAWESWAQAADDALFRRSERGEGAQDFFEGMRLIRRHRSAMEKEFWHRLRRDTQHWLRAGVLLAAGRSPSLPVGLSLVDNDDLEESLAVTAMGERAARDAGPQWEALSLRLVQGLNLARPQQELPFGPLAIAESFRQALDHGVGLSVPVRLVLLKLFERHAGTSIHQGVVQANEALRQEGILPQLGSEPARAFRRNESPDPRVPAGQSGPPERSSVPSFLEQVPARGEMPSEAVLLQALAHLRPWAQAATDPAALAPAPVSPTLLRTTLLEQLPQSHRHRDHERAIDLVALVFDFLLKDNALPVPVQLLLGRLQLPYLRVAVLDPHGFAQAHHPARQLLNTLTDHGKNWSQADDLKGTQFEALRATVQRLLDAADDDLNVFEQEHQAWLTRSAEQARRQQQFELRAVQAQEGQDRRGAAQHAVALALTERLSEVSLPGPVRALLSQHWGAALTLMWLRHGPQSIEYRRGVFLLDQIRFVARAHPSSPGVERVAKMSEGLGPLLRQGWALLGQDEAAIDQMVHTVLAFVAERLGTPLPELPARTALPTALAEPPSLAPPLAEPALTPVAAPAPIQEQQVVAQIQVGTWVEFEHMDATHRGKLSWISPFSGRLLMVSTKGLKVADLDPQDLARQLAAGTAQVLPDQAFIQRALASKEKGEPAKGL